MHEILLVGWPRRILFFHVVAVNELEVQQLRCHQVAHLLVVLVERNAWTKQLCSIPHDGENRVVDRALAVRELARNWDTASHVGRVIAVLGAHVHQDDLACFALGRILNVVQDTSVGA